MCQERNRPHSWGLALARIAGVGKNVAATV
jgi:hypothetical protein